MISAVEAFQRLEGLAKDKGISLYAIGKELKFPSSFFSEWKKGKMMPKADKLMKIAEYFCISLEELIKEEVEER